jgi:hypothetical protein
MRTRRLKITRTDEDGKELAGLAKEDFPALNERKIFPL